MNALLTTLHVLAGSATGGMHLAHIALATLGITAASDARADVKCFLFHDEDRANELANYEFGRLVAVRLLAAFTEAYAPSGALVACVNKAAYGAFAARLLDVIAGADRDILRELRCTPGVSNCIVVADAAGASTAAALGHQATVAATEIEEIGFLANFRSFVAYSEELSLSPSVVVSTTSALSCVLSLFLACSLCLAVVLCSFVSAFGERQGRVLVRGHAARAHHHLAPDVRVARRRVVQEQGRCRHHAPGRQGRVPPRKVFVSLSLPLPPLLHQQQHHHHHHPCNTHSEHVPGCREGHMTRASHAVHDDDCPPAHHHLSLPQTTIPMPNHWFLCFFFVAPPFSLCD